MKEEEGPRHHNLTDKDAGPLNSRGGFIAGYNSQSMVTPLSPDGSGGGPGMIITAVDVTPSSDDHPQLMPKIEAAADNTGKGWGTVTVADAEYHSGVNLEACASSGYPVLMPETHDRKRLSPYHKDHFIYRPEADD